MADKEEIPSSENPQPQFKVVFLGPSGSGKSNFMLRAVCNNFIEGSNPTVGASFMGKIISIGDIECKLTTIDLAGDERYKSFGRMYYRDCSAAVFMYDSSEELGFNGAFEFFNYYSSDTEPGKLIFIVGNKSDLASNEIAVEKAQKFSQENGFRHFLSSAKTGENIQNIVNEIGKACLAIE